MQKSSRTRRFHPKVHSCELGGLAIAAFLAARSVFSEPAFAMEPVVWISLAAACFGLLAFARWGVGLQVRQRAKDSWLLLGGSGLAFALAVDYSQNSPAFFFGGLALLIVFLILLKRRRRHAVVWNLALNTLLLFLIALPLADALLTAGPPVAHRPLEQKPYSLKAAQENPERFRRWWVYYQRQWQKFTHRIVIPDPEGKLPFKLRPGSRATFFQSRVKINQLGFRGEEVEREKQGQFRIVALGESTTMGCTLRASDRPWPEVLEEIIQDEIDAEREVKVINAGVAAYHLEHTLRRLREEIFPLEPDLIVVYHGYNGFHLLGDIYRDDAVKGWPKYEDRPLTLLARAEHKLRCLNRLRRWRGRAERFGSSGADSLNGAALMKTRCARSYERLLALCRDEEVPLALATFNLAVNETSDPGAVEFYRAGFPAVFHAIEANRAHNRMLKNLARKHPGLTVVDTSKGLDGAHEQYIDLVHFTQAGRRRLARNVFEGIQKWLAEGLMEGYE